MKSGIRFGAIAAATLAAVLLGGCNSVPFVGSSVAYTYEPRYSFAEAPSYRWADAQGSYLRDSLPESNVRFVADGALGAKGLSTKADKPALVVSMHYDVGSAYDLRTLVLNIARADNGEVVWRGMATGSIKTDAASGELKTAAEAMLAKFPPGKPPWRAA
jgi:hypothetical protein